jgi:GT2 family glycosyltransferase
MKAPIFISQLELTEPITDIQLPPRADGEVYGGVQLLVRMQRMPVGHLFVPADEISASAVARQVWQEFGTAINERRARVALPALSEIPGGGIPVEEVLSYELVDHPLVSVVVCTRDRPQSLTNALREIAALEYSPFEVVVIDNAPSSDATRNVILNEFGDDPRFRYVLEPRPGLSCARNRGAQEASGEIVAFTDDDVLVDRWWLDGIVRGFQAAPDVACVTGMIATAEIDNAAQLYFHIRVAWGVNCDRRLFDLFENRDDSPLFPYAVGKYGSGANFAVARAALKELGDFDEALGAGTPSGAGEDTNMFMRVLLGGHRLAYEPSAIVWHVHRTTLAALSKQMGAYGSGVTAGLAAIMVQNSRARREVPLKALKGVAHMARLQSGVQTNKTVPSGVIKQEVIGLVKGPWLYAKSRRNLKRSPALRA